MRMESNGKTYGEKSFLTSAKHWNKMKTNKLIYMKNIKIIN